MPGHALQSTHPQCSGSNSEFQPIPIRTITTPRNRVIPDDPPPPILLVGKTWGILTGMYNHSDLTVDEIHSWFGLIDKFRDLDIVEFTITKDGIIDNISPPIGSFRDLVDRTGLRWHVSEYAEKKYRHPHDEAVIVDVDDEGTSTVAPWAVDDEWRRRWQERIATAHTREVLERLTAKFDDK